MKSYGFYIDMDRFRNVLNISMTVAGLDSVTMNFDDYKTSYIIRDVSNASLFQRRLRNTFGRNRIKGFHAEDGNIFAIFDGEGYCEITIGTVIGNLNFERMIRYIL